MKNQREIYEALLAGETLKCGGSLVKLNDEGVQVDGENRRIESAWCFDFPQDWNIYEKPKVLTKFYKYLLKDGEFSVDFYTKDGKLRHSGKASDLLIEVEHMMPNMMITSLYIEIEV